MKFVSKFGLGDLVRELVSGFEGVIMAITAYHTGCTHYGILQKALTDKGKIPEWEWVDESLLTLVEEKHVILNVGDQKKKKPRSGIFPTPR